MSERLRTIDGIEDGRDVAASGGLAVENFKYISNASQIPTVDSMYAGRLGRSISRVARRMYCSTVDLIDCTLREG